MSKFTFVAFSICLNLHLWHLACLNLRPASISHVLKNFSVRFFCLGLGQCCQMAQHGCFFIFGVCSFTPLPILRARLHLRFRIQLSVRFPIRYYANRMEIQFSPVRHKNRASTRTILLHPIFHLAHSMLPCCLLVILCFPKFGASRKISSTIFGIGDDWCLT
jgi:hypothetical protein